VAERTQVWLDPAAIRVADRCVVLLTAKSGRGVTRTETVRIALDGLKERLEAEDGSSS
jgi:hypothetical protein